MKRKFANCMFRVTYLLGFLFVLHVQSWAQEMPPRPVSVSFIRNFNFGAFSQTMGGGSVMVSPSGSRTSTGDILLVNMGYLYYPAIFLLEGNPGTVVHLMAGPDAILTGNQGGVMTMIIGDSEPLSPFILGSVSQNGSLQIYIGGTLIVGSPLSNPAGEYSGSFMVMFIQE